MTDSLRSGRAFILPREGLGVGVDGREDERSRRWRTVSGHLARSGKTPRQLTDALNHAFNRVDKLTELEVADGPVLRHPLCKLADDLRDAVLVRLLLSESCKRTGQDTLGSNRQGS